MNDLWKFYIVLNLEVQLTLNLIIQNQIVWFDKCIKAQVKTAVL